MDLETEKKLTKKLQKRLRPDWHELRYDEIRNRPYLIGKEKESDEIQTLYLLRSQQKISFQELKSVITNSNQANVTLAVHSDDSTHLFYKCQMGLKAPDLPNTQKSITNEACSEMSSDSEI